MNPPIANQKHLNQYINGEITLGKLKNVEMKNELDQLIYSWSFGYKILKWVVIFPACLFVLFKQP